MSNGTSDLDRVEKLFNKALWAVGVLGTIAIGSGAAVVFSFNTQLSDTISRAEERIADISQGAEARIREQAEKVSATLEFKLMENIKLKPLVSNAENAVREDMLRRLGDQNGDLMKEVNTTRSSTQAALAQIQDTVETYSTSVEEIQARLTQLIDLQAMADSMTVEIGAIGAPFSIAIGQPSVINVEYKVDGVETKAQVKFEVRVVGLGQTWAREDQVLVPTDYDGSKVSVPITVPQNDETTGINLVPGEHAIKAEVWLGGTMFDQKPGSIWLEKAD